MPNINKKYYKQTLITICCLLTIITLSNITPASAQQTYVYTTSWGEEDSLNNPRGIAVDTDGNIYIADSYNNRIVKYSSNGQFITQWGSFGDGNGHFNEPSGVAVDTADNVYVADTWNNRIQVFSNQGEYLRKIGSPGSSNGQFYGPYAISIDQYGVLYVADSGNNRIQVLSAGGDFISSFGGYGWANGKLNSPQGVAVDKEGNIFVADTGNCRIQKFSYIGGYLTGWGSMNNPDDHFNLLNPKSIATDPEGNIYVADSEHSRVLKYSNTGSYIAQIGTFGTTQGTFNYPCGLTIIEKGYMMIVDTCNNRIQKLSPIYTVELETAAGTAKFSTTAGPIQAAAITEESMSTEGKPNDIQFPNGLFSLTIMCLELGQTATIDIELPSDVPVGSEYWKCQNATGWFPLPIGSDDGDNKITLTLTDGELGDGDGIKNGIIVDPGGPAIPKGLFKVPEVPWGASILTMFLALVTITMVKGSLKGRK